MFAEPLTGPGHILVKCMNEPPVNPALAQFFLASGCGFSRCSLPYLLLPAPGRLPPPVAGCPLCLYIMATAVSEQRSGCSCVSLLPARCDCWEAAGNFSSDGAPLANPYLMFYLHFSSLSMAIMNSSLLWIAISFLFIPLWLELNLVSCRHNKVSCG